MKTKQCPTCGETDLAQFGKDKHRPDGLATYRKTCRAARHARTYTSVPKKPPKERDKELEKQRPMPLLANGKRTILATLRNTSGNGAKTIEKRTMHINECIIG